MEKLEKWIAEQEAKSKEKQDQEKIQILKDAGLVEKIYLNAWQFGASFDREKNKYFVYAEADPSVLSDEEYEKIKKYLPPKSKKESEKKQKESKKNASSAFAFLGASMILLGIILMFAVQIYFGIAIALCSIPFFALHRIINLLIDIYNKLK